MAPRLILFIALVSVASVNAGDPPVGRLISREVYDWNGKRVGLEEYSDVRPERMQAAKAKAEPLHIVGELRLHNGVYWRLRADGGWDYCAECNQTTGGVPIMGPTVQSPVSAPLMYYVPAYYSAPSFGAGVRFGGFRAGVSGGG